MYILYAILVELLLLALHMFLCFHDWQISTTLYNFKVKLYEAS